MLSSTKSPCSRWGMNATQLSLGGIRTIHAVHSQPLDSEGIRVAALNYLIEKPEVGLG